MNKQKKRLWLSVYTIIGSTIGVGIFSIPYVISQAGIWVGFAWLFGVALINLLALLMYAEVIMHTPGHRRLSGLAQRYLGPHWKIPAGALVFLYSWGAMISYIVIGGTFLADALSGLVVINAFWVQIAFALFFSVIVFGGLGFVAWIERYMVWVLFALLLVLVIAGIPHMDLATLFVPGSPGVWFLPFGPFIFAFGAFPAIPEAAAVLENDHLRLRSTILYSSAFVTVFYVLFAGATILISGSDVSVDAISGLAHVIGPWFLLVGSLMGFASIATSFISLGVSIVDGLVYDYKIRYIPAWAMAVFIPFAIFLIGARDFLQIVSITGAILGGGIGLLVLRIYTKARNDMNMPKRYLSIPRVIVWALALAYLAGVAFKLFL